MVSCCRHLRQQMVISAAEILRHMKYTAPWLTWRAWRWERDEIVQINKISIVSEKRLCRLFLTLWGRWLAGRNGFNRVSFDRRLWRHVINADQLLHATEVPCILPCDGVSCWIYKAPTALIIFIMEKCQLCTTSNHNSQCGRHKPSLHNSHSHLSMHFSLTVKSFDFTSCLKKTCANLFFVRTLSNMDRLWKFLAQR